MAQSSKGSTKQGERSGSTLPLVRDDSYLEDFIRKGTTLEAPTVERLKYETKLVAFLDILGFIERVDKKKKDEAAMLDLYEDVVRIRNYARNRIETLGLDNKIRMLALSDCIVLVCDEKDALEFVKLISLIIHNAMDSEEPFLIRGGISYGEVLVEKNVEAMQIIGPGYSDAFILQEKVAEYPRVAIGKDALAKIEGVGEEFVLTCVDGIHYLNFIKVLEKLPDTDIKSFCDTASTILREKCESLEDSIKTAKIQRKFSWIINYLEEGKTWQKKTS